MSSATTASDTNSAAATDGKQQQQPQKQHKLQDSWSVYWKREGLKDLGLGWKESMERICTFDTVEKFWACWAHLPKPNQVFTAQNQEKGPFSISAVVEGKDGQTERRTFEVSQLHLFRQDIRPYQEYTLEDGTRPNKMRLTYETTGKVKVPMDEFWNKLWEYGALTLIGESCPYSEYITGIQLQQKKKRNWRIEIWLSTADDKAIIDSIISTFREILKQIANDVDCSDPAVYNDQLVKNPDGIEFEQK